MLCVHKLPAIFCRAELRCQLQLTYRTTVEVGSLRTKTIGHESISYFSDTKSKLHDSFGKTKSIL